MIPKHQHEKPLCKPLDSCAEGQLAEDIHSEFQQIQINQHPLYGNQLILNGDLQISESDMAYNTAMVAPLQSARQLQQVAILGGGDGGVLQEVLSHCQSRSEFNKAILVEIDIAVIRLSREYLHSLHQNAFDDPKSEVIIGDALGFIENTHNLDGVIYDLTMDPIRDDISHQEYIAHIMATIAKSLNPGGIVSMQCCGQCAKTEQEEKQRQWLLQQIHQQAEKHFIGVIEQQVYVPSFHEKWTFLAAVKPDRR